MLFITEKILCSSEPPRSLISFVPIDFRNRAGGAAGLGADSIPAIDQEHNNLVYTATVETDQETQEQLHYSKGLGEFKIATLSGINLFIFTI